MAKKKSSSYIATTNIDFGGDKTAKPGDSVEHDEALEMAGSIVPSSEYKAPAEDPNKDQSGKRYRIDETGHKVIDPEAAGEQPEAPAADEAVGVDAQAAALVDEQMGVSSEDGEESTTRHKKRSR